MAAGDLITGAVQYEWASILMGTGTLYVPEEVSGLDSMPDLRTDDLDRNDDHGSVVGLDLMGSRLIEMSVTIDEVAGSNANVKLRALAAAMQPRKTLQPFVFQRQGEVKKQLSVRPRRRSFTSDYDLAHGLARGTLQWLAPDPRIYALAQSTQTITIPPGSSSASATFAVGGDFHTAPKFSIAGTGTNPRLAVSAQTADLDGNSYSGRTTAFDLAMITTDTLVLDEKAKTALLNGANAYQYRRNDNQWWELMPGNNTVTVTRTGTTGTQTYTITWYSAWL